MIRARVFKKTLHYLLKDARDFASNIIVPVLIWLVVIVVGASFAYLATKYTVLYTGFPTEVNALILIPFLLYGVVYYVLCEWIRGSYIRAKNAIDYENKNLMSNIKDPK